MTVTSAELIARLKAVECRDSTWTAADPPLVFEHAFGSEVHDVEGRRYVDLCAGFGALPLGHNHPAVRAVFARYAGQAPASVDSTSARSYPLVHGMGDVYPSRAKIELLEQLLSLMPSRLNRAALALSGSQAVEIALKTAMLATGKSGFIAFADGYHGLDLGVLPVTARPDFRKPFATWISAETKVQRLAFGCSSAEIQLAISELAADACGFAGVIVEPIQGRGGVVIPAEGWLAGVVEMVHAAHGLAIFDEVFVGLGRTGVWTHGSDIAADLICLGKALGGGMPLSACVGTKQVMDAWPESQGEALHTGTFFGHPLSCEIGRATLNAIVAEKLCERARDFGAEMLEDLRQSLKQVSGIVEIRGRGMMLGIEFASAGSGAQMMDMLRRCGVLALAAGPMGQILQLSPALNLSHELWTMARQSIVASARIVCSR